MNNQILVTGAMGFQGSKIVKFLRSRNYDVVGVDKYVDEEKNSARQFFKLDLKHRDSVRLLTEICKPVMVIYCPNELRHDEEFIDFSNITFMNLMLNLDKTTLKSLALCVDSDNIVPQTLADLSTYNLIFLTNYFADKYNLQKTFITQKDNLLKTIKRIVIEVTEGGGEDGSTNDTGFVEPS